MGLVKTYEEYAEMYDEKPRSIGRLRWALLKKLQKTTFFLQCRSEEISGSTKPLCGRKKLGV
jgi:hypothetical protein